MDNIVFDSSKKIFFMAYFNRFHNCITVSIIFPGDFIGNTIAIASRSVIANQVIARVRQVEC